MLITVRVHPRAARARTARNGDQLEIWVTAPPAGGAANEAVIDAVAREFGVRRSAVSLKSGAHARTKVVEIREDGGPNATRRPRNA